MTYTDGMDDAINMLMMMTDNEVDISDGCTDEEQHV